MVVLACEEVRNSRVLQPQVYSTGGHLRSKYLSSRSLKDDPQAEISIDGNTFPVSLLFADDYAVLANTQEGLFPPLSDRLVVAMQTGKTMILRFDLLAERPVNSLYATAKRSSIFKPPVAARRSPPCAVAPARRENFESSLLLH